MNDLLNQVFASKETDKDAETQRAWDSLQEALKRKRSRPLSQVQCTDRYQPEREDGLQISKR